MDPLGAALRAAAGGEPPRPAGRDDPAAAVTAPGGVTVDAPAEAVEAGEEAAAAAARRLLPLQPVLVLGAGGRVGSALLAEALVAGRFASVQARVAAPLSSTLRGLVPLTAERWAAPGPLGARTAFVVFDRERFSNGRDDAFVMPQPAELPALAQRLFEGGVRHLLVLVPHASSMLPHALGAGLASHDEAQVAALGFEHVVLLRPSQDAAAVRAGSRLARFAQWWLAQLRWMVPQREQPLRAVLLARVAVQVAQALPHAAPGTHVLPQPLLWELAHDADGGQARLAAWWRRGASG